MDATARESSWNLREWVKKLARDRLGKDTGLAKVLALLERASRITERRNAFVHILCGKDQDGNPVAATEDLTVWKPLPTVADLDALSADMKTLRLDISRARLGVLRGELHVGKQNPFGLARDTEYGAKSRDCDRHCAGTAQNHDPACARCEYRPGASARRTFSLIEAHSLNIAQWRFAE